MPETSLPVTGFLLTSTDGAPPAADAEWIPALVPGGVHESLLAAGKIEHPYFAQNELEVAWVHEKTWWFKAEPSAPVDLGDEERLILVLHGLDLQATVFLNGTELGTHRNQHREARFDVTGKTSATNELLVRIAPHFEGVEVPWITQESVARMRGMLEAGKAGEELTPENIAKHRPAPNPNLARTAVRKASFSWGWDFAPHLPSMGLHLPVELVRERFATITGHHIRTVALDVEARTATLALDIEIDGFAGDPDTVRTTITAPDGTTQMVELAASACTQTEIALRDAQPWWTHDLGDQPLYGLTIELLHDGELLDVVSDRFGVRTIELDQTPDAAEGGELFRFVLNGAPIFARGANYVPASMFIGSVTDELLRGTVEAAARGEMNMLRIWGGGVYEQKAFYNACDELGVLVWQDFMFACDDYPDDDEQLAAETALEAEYQLKRLRNHPSIAIWAGNNEIHILHTFGWFSAEDSSPGWGWKFWHELLPAKVAQHAPGAIYWPSSPWADTEAMNINGVDKGDRHAWEVWHGLNLSVPDDDKYDDGDWGRRVHFHRYGKDTGRFISEFGIHASPELATLERWTEPGTLALRNDVFDHRNKDNPKDKSYAMMERETGLPQTLEQYVDYSMACQAEGMKYGIEHYRRRQPTCSGTLVWQLNDPWPGISWSVMDHELVPKASYYFMQRVYRPVIATFRTNGDALELWVSNSARESWSGELMVEIGGFTGSPEVQEKVRVTAPGNSSQVVWSGALPAADKLAWVSSTDGSIEPNRAFFDFLKNLPLAQSSVSTVRTSTGPGTATLELTSQGYSYFARVLTPVPGVTFDANYLDIRDGETRTIRVSGLPEGFDLNTLQVQTYTG